ncbi:MAG: CinA family protein [Thermodesulfovibrionales bacterium]|jgi:PncC family amidohydrolase
MLSDPAAEVSKTFRDAGMTVSAAESCTGGLISHYLTGLPGASAFFLAGVVAYSPEAKMRILGVSPETIARCGLVSNETAGEMAERIRDITNSDYAVSSTGNLGPGVLEGKEKGLVYIAVSRKGRTETRELRLRGEREENKREAALSALAFLLESLEKDKGEG